MNLFSQDYTDLKDKVDEALSCVKADFIPTICRGRDILCYHDTSDGQFKEYDFDKLVLLVFKTQNLNHSIGKSKNLGRLIIMQTVYSKAKIKVPANFHLQGTLRNQNVLPKFLGLCLEMPFLYLFTGHRYAICNQQKHVI